MGEEVGVTERSHTRPATILGIGEGGVFELKFPGRQGHSSKKVVRIASGQVPPCQEGLLRRVVEIH